MTDKGASVLALLKQKADKIVNAQNYLQLFCEEEFIRRLSKSKYADNFILKGGFFLYCLTNFDSRVTYDIDFLLNKIPHDEEKLKEILIEIISTQSGNDFISFEIRKISKINLQMKYHGLSVSLVGKIKNTKTPFNIDFGVGDIIFPSIEKRKLPTQLKHFDRPIVNTYSIESTIAEKIDSILHLKDSTSRMKDFFDIYYLSFHFDFEGSNLIGAFKTTFINRNRKFNISDFNCVLNLYKNNDLCKLWQAFINKVNITNISFKEVLFYIYNFLHEPLEHLFNDKPFNKHWNSSLYKWE